MNKIEIIGMRKKRDIKIVFTIITIAILLIIICTGIIAHNKIKAIEVSKYEGSISEIKGDNVVENNIEENEQKTEKNTEEQKEFINKINNIYNGTEGKRVFLTFDDGPTKEVTPHILDTLDKYNIKATFFVLGNRVKANPDILKREYDSGHYIANHGYSHKYSKIYINADSVLDEYNKTEEAIRNAIGDESYSSNLFRFPGGSQGGPYDDVKKKACKKLNENGIAYIDWSALTYDAAGAKTESEILSNLKKTIN